MGDIYKIHVSNDGQLQITSKLGRVPFLLTQVSCNYSLVLIKKYSLQKLTKPFFLECIPIKLFLNLRIHLISSFSSDGILSMSSIFFTYSDFALHDEANKT